MPVALLSGHFVLFCVPALSALSGPSAAAIQRGYQAEVPPQGPGTGTAGGGDVGQSSTSGKSCGKMFLARTAGKSLSLAFGGRAGRHRGRE